MVIAIAIPKGVGHALRALAPFVVAAIVAPYLFRQVRKPTRWLGRFFAWGMNNSHAELTDWGLRHASIGKDFTILDVGCGGGRTIQKMAAIATDGRVFGVDYSAGSVSASRATNARLIREGRVEVQEASVAQLPFPDATFDLVTAVETHYYWPDLPHDLREVLRVVKPGGSAIVIAETFRGSPQDAVMVPAMKLLRAAHLTESEHREWFTTAGFSNVEVFTDRGRGWICVTGRKPGVAR
jgi:SAM-dependent methyltransferase